MVVLTVAVKENTPFLKIKTQYSLMCFIYDILTIWSHWNWNLG